MKLNKIKAADNKEHRRVLLVSGQCGGSSAVSLANNSAPCASTMLSKQLLALFSLWIVPFTQPFPPFNFSLINHCDRCLVPLVWGLMAARCEFTSNESVTLSNCQVIACVALAFPVEL